MNLSEFDFWKGWMIVDYPQLIKVSVENIFSHEVSISLNSSITFFIGANGSGKTQTLKALRDKFKNTFKDQKVRYLSSNRMGMMEQYRSQVNQYGYSPNDYSIGDRAMKTQRLSIETATGDFFTMDDKKDVYIKVAERLSVLFQRQIYLRWDSGQMKAYFEKNNGNKEYPVASEASGLVNLISIMAALFNDEVNILLIDEPEVSLHPQMQSYLLREMKRAANRGKTIIVSTHSSEMMSLTNAKDFCNFVFFEEDKDPVQISPDAEELKSSKLQEFLVRMGQNYRNAFFAKKILLIEGVSDMIMCRAIENKLELDTDIAGAHIIPVEGKGQFPVITKLLRLVNKEIAILTDLDGFIDDNSIINLFSNLPKANEIANKMGMGTLSEIIQKVKNDSFSLIDENKDNMKDICSKHPYCKNADNSDVKTLRRAMTGQIFSTGDLDIKEWPNAENWISIKKRLSSVFSQLEQLGLFILRKGALESYYISADSETYTDKPSEAIKETLAIETKNKSVVINTYDDIIRPLKYISLPAVIDESFAVRKELLSELPLALEILRKNPESAVQDIYTAIKQIKNVSTSIFKYEIIKEMDKTKLRVAIETGILEVIGFPFDISLDDNVNKFVDEHVRNAK